MPRCLVNDLEIAYELHGEGDPVLMINGIGANRHAWGQQIPTFADEFTVFTFDNRDVGETITRDPLREYGMDQFAVDAAGLLDHLEIDSAHVVGASMGGAIAQEFAIGFPNRTKSLTIVCSWPATDPWMHELMSRWDDIFRTQGGIAWARNSWLWVFTHRYYAESENLQALVDGAATDLNPQSLDAYLRQSAAFKRHDALGRLSLIDCPTHVICGEEDIYTPLRYSIDIANAIPGATLSILPEVGHGMFWEATDSFNALVLRFLRDSSNR